MGKAADWLNDPEYVKLVKFLVEKTKGAKIVLNLTELAREFKKQSDSEQNLRCLESRIKRFRSKIHKTPHLDIETKVKLLIGLSAPVNHGFLRELQDDAEVTVDDSNRIIHYKKNEGGFELQGVHDLRKAETSNNQILEFLARKVEETSGIIELSKLAEQLKAETGSSQNVVYLYRRIRQATEEIYESELFDEEMKVRMMFATSTEVEDYALKKLRKEAEVEVDDFNRIVHYKKNDGGLELNGKHYPRKAEMTNDEILKFLAKKVEETSGIIEISTLAKQLKDEIGSSQHDRHLTKRIREATKQIYKSELFNEEMKARMIFATRTQLEDYVLKELQENANIVVDEDNRIIKYRKNDGSLNLKREAFQRVSFNQKQKRKSEIKSDDEGDSEEEDVEGHEHSGDDSEEEEETMEVTTKSGRISKKRFSDASLFNNKDDNGPSLPRNERSKSSNTPKTSNKKRKISQYVSGSDKKKGGILNLNKKECKLKHENGNNTVDESDDVEDSDEDVKDDDSEEEKDTMKLTARSGRLSKKRFSDVSLFDDKDDMGCSSSRNKGSKNSNIPKTSNEKRKISEHTNGWVEKKKTVQIITPEEEEIRERTPVEEYDNDFSFDVSYQPDDEQRDKLEPFKGSLNDDTTRGNIFNNEDGFAEEIPAPIDFFVAPEQEEVLMEINPEKDEESLDVSEKSVEDAEGIDKPIQQNSTAPNENLVVPKDKEMLMDVKEEKPDVIIHNIQIDKEVEEKQAEDIMEDLDDSMEMNSSNSQVKNGQIQHFPTSSEDVKEDETSLILIIESFHDFINILDLPILSDIQKKIEAKLEECKKNSKMISNQLIYFSLELCLLKVNEKGEMDESVESFRLETFIRHLRHAVVHMKCPSLMEFQEKLKKYIGELRVQNKFVPVTAIRSALQNVIDNVINF